MRPVGFQVLALGLMVMLSGSAPTAVRADTPYVPGPTYARVIQSGEKAGTVAIPAHYRLFMGGLSDTGQLVFSAGLIDRSDPDLLIQYAGGKFTPIVMPGSGPVGEWAGDVYWPSDVTIDRPASVNASGNVVFSANHAYGSSSWGTFLWDAGTGHITRLALKEMPATGDLTFVNAGGYSPAINSRNEVALVGMVKEATGRLGYGLFRVGSDGVMEPVCRPHETLTLGSGDAKYVWDPGGDRISINEYPMPSIDDTGKVAFLAHPDGSGNQNAYLWAHGTVTPILTVGASGPIGGKFLSIKGVFLNNTNAWALVVASTDVAGSSRYGLFRVVNGQAAAVALPGQGMPGGGQLQTVQYAPSSAESYVPSVAVSPANGLGEHVFLATLTNGTEAIYKIDQYGGLSFVANDTLTKPGTVTITATTPRLAFVPGSRPSINRRGQIAFTVRYEGGPDMVILMTPR